ncbi:alpha/beta hydrolase [Candidatus Enterococcus ferrettii]|uniref:Alpha/beta hydrolase fold-3 domain-containing protein n=1 Tax=Candidatus Enterococcus ferrettii TaxID=2815324 RepID=A0ABV0EM63_9ENTE|nr:alpha/beta hydrolase [Enterococcus sp. 665A]MBO1341461.1 alpha/beta hydrolase [Enterococcus sp. 665A]
MKKTITLTNGAAVDIYPTDSQQKIVLYFHGGGLIYGSKNDLPSGLRDLFLAKDCTVLAVDYLLAPNSTLSEIMNALEESFYLLKESVIGNRPFGFCGRSAGGYLMLLLTKRLLAKQLSPDFLINFYGYTDLSFIQNERQLLPLTIEKEQIATVGLEGTIWDDPLLTRFLLYHYAVQQNLLLEYYDVDSIEEFSVADADLAKFPRIFSSASTSDKEIPFSYSKKIARLIPDSCFKPVYYLDHDFLKESDNLEVQKVLHALEEWL